MKYVKTFENFTYSPINEEEENKNNNSKLIKEIK
jgi:hypothetical protein